LTAESGPSSEAFPTDPGSKNESPRSISKSEAVGGLELDFFPLMHNATLRWSGIEPQLRRDVEVLVARAFAAQPAPETPVGGWFLTTATGLFGGLFLAFLVFLISQWRTR
jgi:hypothetical protein